MARHFSRLLPLVRWHYLRWGLVIPAIPLALWACNSHPLKQPLPKPQQETDFPILLTPEREVDILFLVDNSPSMDPKQTALAKNFPLMIGELDKLPDGRPDLHIGVVSSDMGAGGEGIGGNCNVVLGDRGLLWGNDPTPGVRATVAGGTTNGCGLNSGARWIEDIQAPNGAAGRQMNYSGGSTALATVFSCLATAVGVGGCGFEHQLQAVRVALNPQKLADGTDVNMANVGFLRDRAYLAIVIITDEDDCSAEPNDAANDSMFLQKTKDANGVTTETASMRCAARGHLCNAQPIPDYTDPSRGYTGSGFSTNFSACAPKDQLDPNHPDPAYLPLIRVQDMIDSVKKLKARPSEQILVSGIIGWPPDTVLDGVTTSDQYRINKDSTSIKGQDQLWDYMPICTIPTQTSADGNIYKAYGGLRLQKFVDAFKRNDPKGVPMQNVFSICNSDFTSAMTQIGKAIASVMKPGCVLYPLVDAQQSPAVGQKRGPLQPECQAVERIPCDKPNTGDCDQDGYTDKSLLECKDKQGNPLDPASLDPSNPTRTSQEMQALFDAAISPDQRPCWYLSYDNTPGSGCPEAYNGQRISALHPSGTKAPPGTQLQVKCLTCARPEQACTPLHPDPPTPDGGH
jgi:hypothetical protein